MHKHFSRGQSERIYNHIIKVFRALLASLMRYDTLAWSILAGPYWHTDNCLCVFHAQHEQNDDIIAVISGEMNNYNQLYKITPNYTQLHAIILSLNPSNMNSIARTLEWDTLPIELRLEVLERLDFDSLTNARLVSQQTRLEVSMLLSVTIIRRQFDAIISRARAIKLTSKK